MNELNKTTGLPVLPDGQFWRVREVDESYFGFRMPTTSTYVEIVEKMTVTKIEDKIYRFLGLEIAWGTEPKTVETEVVIYQEPIYYTKTVTQDVFDTEGEKIGIRDVEMWETAKTEELTADLILEAAKRALVKLATNNKARGYLGDYPPKSIRGDVAFPSYEIPSSLFYTNETVKIDDKLFVIKEVEHDFAIDYNQQRVRLTLHERS